MVRLRSSVALCTCNGAAHVETQVESLFAQTRAVDEIVAIDDASGDGTFALLETLARRSPVPMQVLRNDERLGIGANFERAIGSTHGDVVFLCDQDDRWSADKVERCMQVFESQPLVLLVHSDALLVDAFLAPLGATLFEALEVSRHEREDEDAGRALDVLLKRNLVTGATAAVRREVCEVGAPFPADWVHDEWLAVLAALMGRIVRIDAPLVEYRQHGGNQIGAVRRKPAQKVEALWHGRADYQRWQLRRIATLAARMRVLQPRPTPAAMTLVMDTLAHAIARASLAPRRWERLPRVAREVLNRRYFRYSRGWNSVARDLLGPIRPPEAAWTDAPAKAPP